MRCWLIYDQSINQAQWDCYADGFRKEGVVIGHVRGKRSFFGKTFFQIFVVCSPSVRITFHHFSQYKIQCSIGKNYETIYWTPYFPWTDVAFSSCPLQPCVQLRRCFLSSCAAGSATDQLLDAGKRGLENGQSTGFTVVFLWADCL